GLWREAIQADLASDARAVAYTAEVNPQLARTPMADPRRYHSFDFLANAYLQLAQEEPVRRMVEGLREVGSLPPAFLPSHTGFAAIPVRYAFERGAWAEAAALWVPRTPFPQAEAITWFGRAIGAARSGDAVAAAAHLAQIRTQRERLIAANQGYWAGQVEIQE